MEENKGLHNQMEKMDILMEKTQSKVKGVADENVKLKEALKKVQNDPLLGKQSIQKMNAEFNQIKLEVERVQKEQQKKLTEARFQNIELQQNLQTKQKELDRANQLLDKAFKAED